MDATEGTSWRQGPTESILTAYRAILDSELEHPASSKPLRGQISNLRSLAGYYIRRDRRIYDAWMALEDEAVGPDERLVTGKAKLWEKLRFIHHVFYSQELFRESYGEGPNLGGIVLHAYDLITLGEKRGSDDVIYGIVNALRCWADPYMAAPPWISDEGEPSMWLCEWRQIVGSAQVYEVPKAQRWDMRDLLHEVFVEEGLLGSLPMPWGCLALGGLLDG